MYAVEGLSLNCYKKCQLGTRKHYGKIDSITLVGRNVPMISEVLCVGEGPPGGGGGGGTTRGPAIVRSEFNYSYL